MFTSVCVSLGLLAISVLVLAPVRAGSAPPGASLFLRPAFYGAAAFFLAAPVFGPMAAAAAGLAMLLQEAGVAAARRSSPGEDPGAKVLGCLAGHAAALAPVAAALVIAREVPESSAVFGLLWLFAGALSGLCLLALLPVWPLDGGRCLTLVLDACSPASAATVTAIVPLVFVVFALQLGLAAGVALAIVGALLALSMRNSDGPALAPHAAALALAAWLTTAAAHGTAFVLVISQF